MVHITAKKSCINLARCQCLLDGWMKNGHEQWRDLFFFLEREEEEERSSFGLFVCGKV